MHQEQLIKKICDRSTVVAIIGMGYVGLPLTLRFSETGFRVIGLDVDAVKIEKLNRGESYIQHIRAAAVAAARANGFSATSDFSRLREADAIIICVPAPLNKCREPDLSFVLNTTNATVTHVPLEAATNARLDCSDESRTTIHGRSILTSSPPIPRIEVVI